MTRTNALFALFLGGCAPLAPSSDAGTTTETETYACDPVTVVAYNPGFDTCLDTADTDGDGLRNCDDSDADGDGLRNIWDAGAFDVNISTGPAAGFGVDGALSVASGETVTLSPATYLDHDAVQRDARFQVQDMDALRLHGESLEGAELLVLVQQGADAGLHQLVYVASEGSNGTLNVEPPLASTFEADQTVLVQRVPHYSSVELASGATLKPKAWSDGGSGVLMFRVNGELQIAQNAKIDASYAGFNGGSGAESAAVMAEPGESYALGLVLSQGQANAGGGGGGPMDPDEAVCGAGGAFGTEGEEGYGWNDEDGLFASGGQIYGEISQQGWYLGSGGGGGSFDPDSNGNTASRSGAGGAGGGLVVIFAYGGAVIDGAVLADGGDGQDAQSTHDELGGGGGGSGGQLLFVTPELSGQGRFSTEGGAGGGDVVCGRSGCRRLNVGGSGGEGRMRVDADSLQGVTTIQSSYKPGNTHEWHWTVTSVGGHCDTDADGDGFIDAACGGDDCLDSDPSVNPGAREFPDDGIDSDCDRIETCTGETGMAYWIQGQE